MTAQKDHRRIYLKDTQPDADKCLSVNKIRPRAGVVFTIYLQHCGTKNARVNKSCTLFSIAVFRRERTHPCVHERIALKIRAYSNIPVKFSVKTPETFCGNPHSKLQNQRSKIKNKKSPAARPAGRESCKPRSKINTSENLKIPRPPARS